MDYICKLISQQKYISDYFMAHSSQRLTTFNFYLVLFASLCAGYGYSYKGDIDVFSRIVLSLLLVMFSIVFYFLDKRCKKMIKNSEVALMELEAMIIPSGTIQSIHIFRFEKKVTDELKENNKKICPICFWRKHYSYSDCFVAIFVLGGLLGLIGFIFSLFSN